jgi:hypothetical protein
VIARALLLALALAACGDNLEPELDVSMCEPLTDAPTTLETCECHGGEFQASLGTSWQTCPEDETEIGTVRFGIEGGLCCAAVRS